MAQRQHNAYRASGVARELYGAYMRDIGLAPALRCAAYALVAHGGMAAASK
jgi:hypothetical protein